MGKYNLLILDEDIYYLNNLINYISSEFISKLNAISFSNQESLNKYLYENERIHIVLTSKAFYDINEIRLKDSLIIVLDKDNSSYKNLFCIRKYQSAEKICKEIIQIYESSKENHEGSNENIKVLSFYSPIGGIGTTTIAINMAFKLVEQGQKVLYLNFENIQSTGIFMPKVKNKYNFSDLILSIKDRSEDFEEILEIGALKYEDLDFYYFNPIDSILDLEDLSVEDVKELIDKLTSKSKFNYIVCDLPSYLNSKYYYLFEKSASVISIMGQDVISNYKVDTMLKQLDNIKNFKFVFNMYDSEKERLIPKLVANNLLPIIGFIHIDKELKGVCDIKEIKSKAINFNMKINEIIREI